MTNAEKYLKDGLDVEFVDEFEKFCAKQTGNQASSVRLIQFLSRTIKPQLTEDERVILSNIPKELYFNIARDNVGDLFLLERIDFSGNIKDFSLFNHLFQFIEERKRIFY